MRPVYLRLLATAVVAIPLFCQTPSFFTAIQEQLPSKLESTKGPVDVIVMDNVQKPPEN